MKNLLAIFLTTITLFACGGGGGSGGKCNGSAAICSPSSVLPITPDPNVADGTNGNGITGTTATTGSGTTTTIVNAGTPTTTNGNPSVARFAGQWTGSFTGSDFGSCPNITVDTSGNVSGTCSASHVASFGISGTINAAGAAYFTATTSAVFVGTLTSDTTASGTWSIALNGATGTWTAVHQ